MKTNSEIQGFIVGLGVIIILVKILKRTLRMPRPLMETLSTYGMPSTRGASFMFIITYIILTTPNISKLTIVLLISVVLICCGIKWSMKEHSLLQLTVGGIIGVLGAIGTRTVVKVITQHHPSEE